MLLGGSQGCSAPVAERVVLEARQVCLSCSRNIGTQPKQSCQLRDYSVRLPVVTHGML